MVGRDEQVLCADAGGTAQDAIATLDDEVSERPGKDGGPVELEDIEEKKGRAEGNASEEASGGPPLDHGLLEAQEDGCVAGYTRTCSRHHGDESENVIDGANQSSYEQANPRGKTRGVAVHCTSLLSVALGIHPKGCPAAAAQGSYQPRKVR